MGRWASGREGRAILSSRGAWCVALGALGVGLALLGTGLVVAGRTDSIAFGQNPAGRASGQGVVIATQSLGDNNEVMICLVDAAQQRLLVYLADARRSRLRLVAARDISADWSLTDFNNDSPTPKDVRGRAEKAADGPRPPAAEMPKPATVP